MISRKHIHKVVLCLPYSWLNWNLEMLVFEVRGKPEDPEKNLIILWSEEYHSVPRINWG